MVAILATTVTAYSQPSIRSVGVDGTQFRVMMSDGKILPQGALPGTVISFGDRQGHRRSIRIDAIKPDARDRSGETVLYTFSEQDAAGAGWHNICDADPDGQRLGFPLGGSFSSDMRYTPSTDRVSIVCTGGAEGKCIRFGYKPWGRAPDGSSLAPYYQACLRLVRADYLGNGVGHTRNGMPIDIFDRIGVQKDEVAPGMTLEAAWGPDGALCVRHTRLANDPPLEALARQSSHLLDLVGPACDDAHAGLLFDRSFEP